MLPGLAVGAVAGVPPVNVQAYVGVLVPHTNTVAAGEIVTTPQE